jgi:formylglycine-generating enzyme required for sulfatase activity
MMKSVTRRATLGVLLILSASITTIVAKDGGRAPFLRLPRSSVELKIVQRHSQAIPGSRGTMEIQIGDITGGQVRLSVITSQGKKLVDLISMSVGDTATFTVQEQEYDIRIRKLCDLPLGDYALLVVSGDESAARVPDHNLPDKTMTLKIDDNTAIEAVYIQPETFLMGRDTKIERVLMFAHGPITGIDEGPQRKVVITKGFYIARYKVTCDVFCKFLNSVEEPQRSASIVLNWFSRIEFKDGRYVPKAEAGNCAVNTVPWEGANKFCKWLSHKTGQTVRLPTEAEWELAARGPEAREFPWGHEELTERWTYDPNSKEEYPHLWSAPPVDAFPSNTTPDSVVGMVDCAVGEWCSDYYGVRYLPDDTSDPKGPSIEELPVEPDVAFLASTKGTFHVLRGRGSSGRATVRQLGGRVGCEGIYGFRILVELPAK